MNNIAVFGGTGNIGLAVVRLLTIGKPFTNNHQLGGLDDTIHEVVSYDTKEYTNHYTAVKSVVIDFGSATEADIVNSLKEFKISHVINALPFFLNSKVAGAAAKAGCHYQDFTEDDEQAAAVYEIYKAHPNLACAPKCGLAPGFINYLGHSLTAGFDSVDYLGIRVGALPRNVRSDVGGKGDGTYALSWSVDGLVNEYIRKCQIKVDGVAGEQPPLQMPEELVLDGIKYEALTTSGGVGSLIQELPNVPNINYKTLRYPGHYDFVKRTIAEVGEDFDALKARFLETYPYTKDDVIVVYGEAVGQRGGRKEIESFTARYLPGHLSLSGIQLTTAGGALAVLEIILQDGLKGAIKHGDIDPHRFWRTHYFKSTYTQA